MVKIQLSDGVAKHGVSLQHHEILALSENFIPSHCFKKLIKFEVIRMREYSYLLYKRKNQLRRNSERGPDCAESQWERGEEHKCEII